VLVLFIRDLYSSFFSFKREGFDLKGLSLGQRKFNLRESFGGSHGGSLSGRVDSRLGGLKRSLKIREVGVHL